jgi:acetyl esterase/lipase
VLYPLSYARLRAEDTWHVEGEPGRTVPVTALRERMTVPGRPELVFDFTRPATAAPAPLLVFVHGGGWISGDLTMYADEAVWAAEQGMASACISYRLAPLHTFPAAVADVQAFMRHAATASKELGIDPTRVVVVGNSAGGYLAAMAGLCPHDFGTDGAAVRPSAVVSLSGISDLRDPDMASEPIAMTFVEQFMGGTFAELQESYGLASPVAYVDRGSPPFLVVHGDDDEIVPVAQSRQLVAALRAAGVETTYHELPGEGHSYSYPAWLGIRDLILEFVNAR